MSRKILRYGLAPDLYSVDALLLLYRQSEGRRRTIYRAGDSILSRVFKVRSRARLGIPPSNADANVSGGNRSIIPFECSITPRSAEAVKLIRDAESM